MGITPNFKWAFVALFLIPTIVGCAANKPAEPPAYPPAYAEGEEVLPPDSTAHCPPPPTAPVCAPPPAAPVTAPADVIYPAGTTAAAPATIPVRTVYLGSSEKSVAEFIAKNRIMFDTDWADTFLPADWRTTMPSGFNIGKAPAGFWCPDVEVVYGPTSGAASKWLVMKDKNVLKGKSVAEGLEKCAQSEDQVTHFGSSGHVQLRYLAERASTWRFQCQTNASVMNREVYGHSLQPASLGSAPTAGTIK